MNSKRITDYQGKQVNLGIDVHKKTYHMTAICGGKIVKKVSTIANPVEFAKSVKKWFFNADLFSAYEAGFSGFVLHRALEKEGIKSIVINPASIEIAANDMVKTDKKDSAKIARQLYFGNLKPCRIPCEKEELDRLAQRTRQQFIEKRVRVGNQIKSKLFQFGFIPLHDDQVMSAKYLKRIESLDLPQALKITLDLMMSEWREHQNKIARLDREISAQNKNNENIEKIQSVPGIGALSANIIFTELGDMSQFSNQNQLFSFIGLTPSEYSSGDTIRKGKITKQGPSRLRHILVENTWRAISKDKGLREIYDRIKKTRGSKRAIVACARRLIGRIRACLINQQMYKFDPLGI